MKSGALARANRGFRFTRSSLRLLIPIFLLTFAVQESEAIAGFDDDFGLPGIKVPFGGAASFGLHPVVQQYSDILKITASVSPDFPCAIERVDLQIFRIADGRTGLIAEIPLAFQHNTVQFEIGLNYIQNSDVIFKCVALPRKKARAYELWLDDAQRFSERTPDEKQ